MFSKKPIVVSSDGFSVRNFVKDTEISIETLNSIYEIKFIDEPKVWLMGGVKQDGRIRFPDPVEAIFLGSRINSCMTEKWIGRNMRLEFICQNHVLTSSPVKNVIVTAMYGIVFNFNWDQKDQPI